jgi:prepilin-type N-terminal cleavage/methylation domain-containing protein
MRSRCRHSAFTLMELILVMLIVALIAGLLAPSLIHFTAGRAVDNFGQDFVGLCQLARTHATSEAQPYFLVIDSQQVTLSTDRPGQQPPAQQQRSSQNSISKPAAELAIPQGIRLTMQAVNDPTGQPQPRIIELLPWDPTLQPQPQTTQRNGQLLDGTAGGSETLWTMPADSHYIEFTPTGRTDPMTIEITDGSGHSIQIACASPTEGFHVVEAAR